MGEAEEQEDHALEDRQVVHENEYKNSHKSADHEQRVELLCYPI